MSSRKTQHGQFSNELKKGSGMPVIIAAIIAGIAAIIAALITGYFSFEQGSRTGRETAIAQLQPTIVSLQTVAVQQSDNGPQPIVPNQTTPTPVMIISSGQGSIQGVMSDRKGNKLSGLTVRIPNGPETMTDKDGKFVLNDVPSGDQQLMVTASNRSPLIQNVRVDSGQTITVNVIYDFGYVTVRLAFHHRSD